MPREHEPSRPRRVRDATWQAGVTPESWRFKVLLNGEPVVSALAALEGPDGWVIAAAEPRLCETKPSTRAPLGMEYRVPLDLRSGERETVTLRGVVSVVPVSGGRRA